MSATSVPGPAFTQVQLTGPPDAVDRLMAALSSVAEVIFDSMTEPDARGEVSRTVRVVTHPVPRAPAAGQAVSVTVQTVFEAEAGVLPGLPGAAAAQEVEESVTAAVAGLPGIRQASSRLVSAWGLPATRE